MKRSVGYFMDEALSWKIEDQGHGQGHCWRWREGMTQRASHLQTTGTEDSRVTSWESTGIQSTLHQQGHGHANQSTHQHQSLI